MRRFAFSLFLSFMLHAALLSLLQGGRTELAPREIMRISLAELPGESGDGRDGRDDLIPSENYSEPQQPPQPVERVVAAIPAPVPAPVSAPAPTPAPVRAPAPQLQPTPIPAPAPLLTPPPAPAENDSQQGGALEIARASAPPLGGSGGGDTIIDASLLRVMRRVPAEYPMISRRRRDQGTVVLVLEIRSGRVTRVEIERSSGHAALDESARRAVSAWEFDTSGFGESISARIPFVFSLTN